MQLSIITINYNNKNGLLRTIESVEAQTFRDFEWIIIDGASSDGSKDLIEKKSAQFSYWCSERDNGVYHAMNKGIVKAKGTFVLFLNSGDRLHDKDVLIKVFSKQYTSDIIYGDCYSIYKNKIEENKQPELITLSTISNRTIAHQSSFIRTSLFEKNLYDESFRIAADWKWFLYAFFNNRKFEHINVFVSDFYCDGISSDPKYIDVHIKERQKTIDEVLKSVLGQIVGFECAEDMDRFYKIYIRNKPFQVIEKIFLRILEIFSRIR